ncbi:MAG: PAS domain S-box protein, partial [Nitrospinaceae bacterium]|nr:PAS domain S-box protein [Nitrospinaceae bacterium]NIR55237.1 PAS domain S-box protein [Nitrospinaceae bacterium]NIS85671.1 PAS domain S-box protein [Nitrospinaceae bacterium]NIT82516.1 PAS domain S-box protein [Nitrospinaceae bacterium]NIU44721.1 PAS domain S-box protein [Nitrospinaceae bacterium]
MILGKVAEELEQAFEKENPSVVEDTMVRLLLMKDPSTDKNLILGLRVEALDGTRLVKFSGGPVEISGRFAFSAPLYSSATQEVLGEVSFQYNPHFYGELVEDARTKLFWLLGLMAGVIILLHRVLLKMIKPLAQLSVSMREIDFSGTPTLPDSNGMVVSEIGEVVQSMKDLLARLEVSRKKERKTRDQMEQAQAVSHTGSWVWDIKTNALDWSDEIYRIVGMSRGEVEPDYPLFLKLVHPEDREMVESAVARAVAGEEEYDIIHRLVRLDGTIRYIREKSQVTFDENGEAIQMIGTGQDITDQKLAEDLSLRFGRIMDESFNEIYIIDRNTFKFVQINRSAARNMQYTMAEMSEMTPADISPDFSDPKDLEYLFKPLQDGTRDRVIITSRHSRKDGTSYPVEVLLQVSRHESPPKIVAIVQDITERLKAEEAMQEAMQTLEKRVEERTTDLTRAKEEAETYLDIAGSMIVGLNDQGEVTLINKQGCEVLGYSKEEVIGKNWFQNFLPGRDRERVFEVFKKIMFGCFEITERFTNPIVNRSGEER